MPEPVNETPNPCPWCGAEVITYGHKDIYVFCYPCKARGPERGTVYAAIAAWNRVAKANEQTAQSGSEGR